MSTDQQNAVTVTDAGGAVSDTDIAKLYKGLNDLNVSIQNLSRASILNKGAAADHTLNAARDLLANQNFTIHKLFNDLTRANSRLIQVESYLTEITVVRVADMEKEIERISNIGVIKNG